MSIVSLFLLLLPMLQAPPPPPPPLPPTILLPGTPPQLLVPASVDGTVLDSQTKQPIAGATIQLQDLSTAGARLITVTGNDGRFVFRSVPPGRYVIEASRSGYVPEIAGDPLAAPLLAPIPVGASAGPTVKQLLPGEAFSGIRLVLTPGGSISGRLVDDRGETIVGAVLQALKTTYRNGLRERTVVQSVVSNDLGEYRFFMLKPGQYYISVVPTTLSITNVSTPQSFSLPLFYPGTIDLNAATGLNLRVGETIEGVNFLSIPTRNRRITGGVQGEGSDGVQLVLSPANGTARKNFSILSDSPNKTFQFLDVVPGTYILVAQNVYGRTAIPLDIRNSDLLGLRVILGANSTIPVRVRIEGHPPGDDPELEKVQFIVRLDQPIEGLETVTYAPFPDGRFMLDVLRRDYWIDIKNREDYYVKSMTLDGVDVLNQGLRVTGSVDGPMQIVVDSKFGEVQGAVSTNATVVLVPDAGRRNQRTLYRSMRASSGSFYFDKVPPGDYKVFAWSEDTIENGGPWLDPNYLRDYEDRATPIRIEANMKAVLNRPVSVF